MFDVKLLWRSLPEAIRKLDPRQMWRNPVMFVVEIGSVVTTILFVRDPSLFAGAITVWLWLTVVFANLAEAVAEGRGKAQAAALRATRTETMARRLLPDGHEEEVPGTLLAPWRSSDRGGRTGDPRRRRSRRRRGLGRRVGDHGRVGPGHP